MKISTLICGSLAFALTAASLTPAIAAPVAPTRTELSSLLEQVQYRQRSEEEEQFRRQRRGDDPQRAGREDEQRRPRGEDGQRRQQVERNGQSSGFRVEIIRPERRGDGDMRRGEMRRAERGERREQRRENRFERRGNQAYFNGHRGSREQRRGYRYYEGYWFPPAAFLLGAIIAGQNYDNRGGWEDHVDWCFERYGRNYRERDNSYISRDGYRRECVSPFS